MKKIIYILVLLFPYESFSQNDIFKFNNWGKHDTEMSSNNYWTPQKNNNGKVRRKNLKKNKLIKRRRKKSQRRIRWFII